MTALGRHIWLVRVFFASVLSLGAVTFVATARENAPYQPIRGENLLRLFQGRTVISEYQDTNGGIKDFRFTEHHFADGTTDYIEKGQPVEKGRWKIVGQRKICYTYPDNQVFTGTYCFFVYKIDDCYYNYGAGAMTQNGPKNTEWWTSRFIIKGDGGSCEAPVS